MDDAEFQRRLDRIQWDHDRMQKRVPFGRGAVFGTLAYIAFTLTPVGIQLNTGKAPDWALWSYLIGFVLLMCAILPLFWFDFRTIKLRFKKDTEDLGPPPSSINSQHGRETTIHDQRSGSDEDKDS